MDELLSHMLKNLHKDFSSGGVAFNRLTLPSKIIKASRKYILKQLVENTGEQVPQKTEIGGNLTRERRKLHWSSSIIYGPNPKIILPAAKCLINRTEQKPTVSLT